MPATRAPRESEPHSFIKGPGLTEDQAEWLLYLVERAPRSLLVKNGLAEFAQERGIISDDPKVVARRIKDFAEGSLIGIRRKDAARLGPLITASRYLPA